MKALYKTSGTCASRIEIDVQDGVINSVKFHGGCDGNLQGLSRLITDMKAEEAIKKLEGIRCGGRDTSCPDQLAKALRDITER